MCRRTGRGGGYGRDNAAAKPPGRRLAAGRRRSARRRQRGAARPFGGGRPGHCEKTSRRIVRQVVWYHCAALSRQGSRIPRQAATSRQLTLVVPARAKLNLVLAILARRDDGFHEVSTRMQAIALHDLLELTPADSTTLTTSGHQVPEATNNSVLKAHAKMQEAAGRELPTHFHLDKRIPHGSGMGGASSDAAAAMKGLAALHSLKIDLTKIAAQIGDDVPFFLTGGAARAEGRGERLTPLPTQPAWFAIAWPGIELL